MLKPVTLININSIQNGIRIKNCNPLERRKNE